VRPYGIRQRNAVVILQQDEARRDQGVNGRVLAFIGKARAASQSDAVQQLGLLFVPSSVHPASLRATSSGRKDTREVRKEGISAQRRDQGRIAAWGVARPALVPDAAKLLVRLGAHNRASQALHESYVVSGSTALALLGNRSEHLADHLPRGWRAPPGDLRRALAEGKPNPY
jgi:hypothetical protein